MSVQFADASNREKPYPHECADLGFLIGGGGMGRLIASSNWSATSVGPMASWPSCLKTTVSLILRSQVPMVLLWGADGVMIYNDAYSIFAGSRHPHILGAKVRLGWPEVADFNEHVMKVGLAGGTLAFRDQELTLYRSGKPEQVFMNLDYSSVPDENGVPAGVIAIVVETTSKVAAEKWLASERDRQRQMFEQAPGFVAMMTGPDHVIELTNAAYQQLVGHRNVLGKPLRDALPEVAAQGFIEILDKVFVTGEPFVGASIRAEIQRTPDLPKEERFLDLVYQPVRGPAGSVIGIFAQGQDVTDRVLTERAVRTSAARFRTLAEAIPAQVWTSSPDGMLDWFNKRVYEYSGLSEAALRGNGWSTLIHPDDLPGATKTWNESLTKGSFYEVEFRVRRRDGGYRWHLARAVPIRDADDSVVQWIGTNTDIDDQKRAAQALLESERRLQISQQAAGIASLELDIATGMVFGSEGFWDLWGLSPRDSVHISVLENIVIAEDRDIRSNPETRAAGSAVPDVEYRIRRRDTGELRWLSRNIEFVQDSAGKPIKMFGVMQDITGRKEAEARQELLVHELEHRIKNILAMVGAIAMQTLRNTDIDSARGAFTDRLKALAKAHDILNKTRWTDASMQQVIENTIAAFPANRIALSGPPVSINPKMALSLALAVNELGTNALKYGALSNPSGSVRIEWSLDAQMTTAPDSERHREADVPVLTWHWKETGGPPVKAPVRRGFGSLLLERVLATDFGGNVRIEYPPDGVECVLTTAAPPDAERRAPRERAGQ